MYVRTKFIPISYKENLIWCTFILIRSNIRPILLIKLHRKQMTLTQINTELWKCGFITELCLHSTRTTGWLVWASAVYKYVQLTNETTRWFVVLLYIYICIASMIWRFTYICYKSKEQQWKESKNETKKEQQTNIHEQTIT